MSENELTVIEKKTTPQLSTPGDIYFNPQMFEHVQRVANLFATSSLVPDRYKNKLGDCVIALSMAHRLNLDPLMVMQNIYVVHGSPGIEGKMVIALINQCGKFSQLLFREEKNDSGQVVSCTAYTTLRENGEELTTELTWEEVVAHGWNKDKPMKRGGTIKSKWNVMRGQMFRYRAATFFARTFCPEVLFGMQTTEEIRDTGEPKKEDLGDKLISDMGKSITPPMVATEDEKLVVDIKTELPPSSFTSADKREEPTGHPFDRKNWISIKSESSLVKFANANLLAYHSAPDKEKDDFLKKWKRIVVFESEKKWPFGNNEAQEEEQPKEDLISGKALDFITSINATTEINDLSSIGMKHTDDIDRLPENEKILVWETYDNKYSLLKG